MENTVTVMGIVIKGIGNRMLKKGKESNFIRIVVKSM